MASKREHNVRFEEFTGLTVRAALLLALPAAVLVIGAFWVTAHFLEPMPPRRVAFAGGPQGSAAAALAERYRRVLADEGITVELRHSEGAGQNVELLADRASGVDVALVVAGTTPPALAGQIVNISNILVAPLWGVTRGALRPTMLSQLRGKRIGVGHLGSGIHAALAPLLDANDVTTSNSTLLPLASDDAVRALAAGEIDAAFLNDGPMGPQLQQALRLPDVHLISFERADAYARRFPHLVRLELPEGAFDLARNIPDRNVVLIGTTVMLAARADLHPTVIDLFVDAARDLHAGQSLFQKRGEFPHLHPVDAVPISEQAEQYARDGPSLLRRVLPLWLAEFLQRAFTLLIPIVAVVLPLARFLPPAIDLMARRYVYVAYANMRRVERRLRSRAAGEPVDDLLDELDRIEESISGVRESVLQAAGLYTLRAHLHVVRATVAARARARQAAAGAVVT